MKKRVAIYARVSTLEQSTKAQESEVKQYVRTRGWSLTKIYSDRISGIKSARPALDELLGDARRRKFDCVAVWRIDRLGRSVTHLLSVLETFKALGIEFASVCEGIDTGTATGMMVFTVLAAVASLERSILVERVKSGLEQARRRGVRLGRPAIKRLSAKEVSEIRKQHRGGTTLRQLAKAHGTSLWSVHQACAKR